MASSINSNHVGFTSQSQTPQTLIASIIPAIVASTLVLARLYSRVFIMKNWGYDDSWISLAWVTGSVALTILNGILTTRVTAQTPEDLVLTMRLGFASRELYQLCLGATKLSICAFYLRIFQDHASKVIIKSTMGFIALFTFGLSIGIIFQCRPISGDWNNVPAVCGNQDPGIIASAICNILSDIFLMIFVTPRILALKITKQQKISLLTILFLGLLVIVAAAMRMIFTLRVLAKSDAQPWDSYQIAIWSSIEVNSGLFCAAAPAVKPLIRKIAPTLLGPPPVLPSCSNTASQSRRKSAYSCNLVSPSSLYPSDVFKADNQPDLKAFENKT
ncbi:hypothetical protein BDZ45DRAFT_621279 [Acephala macrosclerotiorum]|nr:hypothetical protein BDZ45DRAFT_621279 [Acephala macrosclerotiorum]